MDNVHVVKVEGLTVLEIVLSVQELVKVVLLKIVHKFVKFVD